MSVTALAPWFGSNRLLAPRVGAALAGCEWVGVPFAGGMCELLSIDARTMHVNDMHRFVINLARVVADPDMLTEFKKALRATSFHPDELDQSQEWCKAYRPATSLKADFDAAYHYFITCWMGRSHVAGTSDEFHGRLSTRWNASGGDSNVRYHSAIRSLAYWHRVMRRCTFSTDDVFDFLPRCEDSLGHGIYADPPFPKAGRKYRHNAGQTYEQEFAWHTRLRDAMVRFERTRVVCRFYDHPMIRELYPESLWRWDFLTGGKNQANKIAPEVLLLNVAAEAAQRTLFE